MGASDILVGVGLFLVAGFLGGGGPLFRSSVFWLATADLFFLSLSVKVMADMLSSESIRLVEFRAMAVAALPIGVPWRAGSWTWTDVVGTSANWRSEMRKMSLCSLDSIVIFLFFEVQFVTARMYCAYAYIGVRCRPWSRPLVRAVKVPGRKTKGACVWNMVCGKWWSDPRGFSSFWVTMADSWTEMHGKVLRSLYRREGFRSLCRLRRTRSCLWQAAFSAHKAARLRWCFSVLGLLGGYGVVLERTFLLYPSDLYLYLYFVYLE
jgi:hypothetical protein